MVGVAKGPYRCGVEDQVQCDLGRLLQVFLSEMESLDRKEGQLSNGAVTLVVEFGQSLCKSAASVVGQWASYCGFCAKGNLRALCGYFALAKRVMVDNTISDPVATVTSMLPQSKSSVLLLRNRFAGCEGQNIVP